MSQKFLWIDLETTGLDPEKCSILEVGAIVTDSSLNSIETYSQVIYTSRSELEAMDEWCTTTHTASGLVVDCMASATSIRDVEKNLLALIEKHFPNKERPMIAGNSISFDRSFIAKYMPEVSSRLHYRQLDVSSFKVYMKARYGVEVFKGVPHRSIPDLLESIAELNAYSDYIRIQNDRQGSY